MDLIDNILGLNELFEFSTIHKDISGPWFGHIPFAFYLVKSLEPKLIVELGTYKGDSYLTFCQAVKNYNTGSKCFAIDTWEGDVHSGFYGDEILSGLKKIHDPLFSGFSQFIRSEFDQAKNEFEDGSIDLLHIDGLHTYDAVKHDYKNWLEKMSNRGVILFHDTHVTKDDFGVHRLWNELIQNHPNFSFTHSNGLGILAVGNEVPSSILNLCTLENSSSEILRKVYEAASNSLAFKIFNTEDKLGRTLSDMPSENDLLSKQILNFEQRLSEINEFDRQKDKQLVEHVALASQKDSELAKHVELLNRKNDELSETRNLLETTFRSRSWKITSPLRFLGRIIRGDFYHSRHIFSRLSRQAMRFFPTSIKYFIRHFHTKIYNFKKNILTSPANAKAIAEIVKHRCETTLSAELKSPLTPLNSFDLPAIDISVVTYNSQRWLHGFVESLLGLEYPKSKLSVWFVDNSSTDSTMVTLDKEINKLRGAGFSAHVITRPNNGYGAGHNAGIGMGNAPFCLVTNVDLTFEPDSLSYIAKIASSDDEKTASWEFRQKPYEHPKYYDPVTGFTNWNSHACVLIRRSALMVIGGYDERLFMYGEDVELSYRLRRFGYLLRYCPQAIVWHFSYEKAGAVKPKQYKGSTYANFFIRLKYGNAIDIFAIPFLSMGILFSPSTFPGSKRMILHNIFRLFVESHRLFQQRKLCNHFFPFRGFDYDIIRDGAFFEFLPPSAKQPLVSVITRTYQGRNIYLRQALLSVIQQTYSNIEHIIVEDGGNTHAPLINQAKKIWGNRIRYFPCNKIGRAAAGNYGMTAAKGKYYLFLDDDDLLFADHIEVLLQAIQQNKDSIAAFSLSWEVETDSGGLDQGFYIEKRHFVHPTLYQEFDFEKLKIFNYIPIQSILFHRSLFESRGGFEEDMSALEDWNLWIRYAWRNHFMHVPKVTSIHRTPFQKENAKRRQETLDKAYLNALQRANKSNEEFDSSVIDKSSL